MMDRDPVQQSPSEPGESTNGTSSDPPTPPNPPRLTPNPMLLDSPAPTLTPTTSSPPPPLTPAPSVSVTHAVKAAAASPHVLVSAPPKLTSNAAPALRTYSRPILPSPKTTPATQPCPSPSPSITATSGPSLHSSSSSAATSHTKTSTGLTNGSTRTVSTPTSTPITPFHTPASPPGRQVCQTLPVGSPALVRANQSAPPVRPRVSQQTLLLGKGQDQVLLRAQMLILTSAMRPTQSSSSSSSFSSPSSNPASSQLQSLTLKPPAALTIPTSLRLKRPLSTPPPLSSRPHTPLFPPLRPRPQPGATAPESPTTPCRHLAVPPPTLYSPVRAVPLRPRHLSPNGHRTPSPWQPAALQPIAPAAPPPAAPSSQASSPGARPLAGARTGPLTPAKLSPGQSQSGSLSMAASPFERSPSAARQLQIIALSSGRQTPAPPGTYAHRTPAPEPPEPPEPPSPPKRTLSGEDVAPLPANWLQPKDTPPLPSAPSPPTLRGALGVNQGGGASLEGRGSQGGGRTLGGGGSQGGGGEENQRTWTESGEEEEQMEVTDGGQTQRGRGESEVEEVPMDQEETQTSDPVLDTIKDSEGPSVPPSESMVQNQKPPPESMVQNQKPPESMDQSPAGSASESMAQTEKPPESLFQSQKPPESMIQRPPESMIQRPPESMIQRPPESMIQRPLEPHKDQQSGGPEDFSGNMSDNQSALSSLSSQSPPSSPFVLPPAEAPPPLHPTDLSQHHARRADRMPDAEPPSQSGDESESVDQSVSSPWEAGAWPEGRQVLTHLVEGFVIQEGLQPFPVNRSSLLVPEQVTKPPEVNGTNGGVELPVAISQRQSERSTDSDEEEGGEQDEPGSKGASAHRDRTVLHCQFCGKRGHAHNFMRSKRFCSTSCARGFNVRLTKRLRALSAGSRSDRPRPILNRAESVPGKPLLLRLPRDLWSAGRHDNEVKEKPAENEEEEEDEEEEELGGGGMEDEEEDDDGGEEDAAVAMTTRMEHRAAHRPRRASAQAVTTTTPTSTFQPTPSQWSVEEVTAFIHTLPGCSDVAEAFRLQEIDGQALLLLTEDHLMTSMNIKLGPALKICAHINTLRNL